MKVNSSIFPQWLTGCFSSISSFLSRIKNAVLRAFGHLSEDNVNDNQIIASPGTEETKVKSVRENKLPLSKQAPAPSKDKLPPKQMRFSKTDEDALQNPDLPPEYNDPNYVDTKFGKITDDHIRANKRIIDKDRREHEFDPIIENRMTPREFGKERYTLKVESRFDLDRKDQKRIADRNRANEKFKARLESIGTFYEKNTVYPVRGDGNCFCNSVVAGLLTMIQKKPSIAQDIIAILEGSLKSDIPYVTPADPNSLLEYDYSKNFTKEEDFAAVLQKLKAGVTENSLNDFDFTSKFSRIIRYVILVDTNDGSYPHQTGHEIEMMGMLIINNIFKINAKVVVLENSSQNQDLMVNSEDPNVFLEVPGANPITDPLKVVNTANDPKERADFLVVHRNGHYFAMV